MEFQITMKSGWRHGEATTNDYLISFDQTINDEGVFTKIDKGSISRDNPKEWVNFTVLDCDSTPRIYWNGVDDELIITAKPIILALVEALKNE